MSPFISKTFITLISLFLGYTFIKAFQMVPFIHYNDWLFLLLIGLVMIVVIWLARRLNQLLDDRRSTTWVKSISSGMILLFFIYQLFTPYFYSTDYLTEVGVNKIETYYHLIHEVTNDNDRETLAESALSEMMVLRNLAPPRRFSKGQLIDLKVIEMNRIFNRYEITAEVTQDLDNQIDRHIYVFTLIHEGGDFKLDGFVSH